MSQFILRASKPAAVDATNPIVNGKDDDRRNAIFNKKLYALVNKRPLRLLDLGCGTGGFVKTCIRDGHFAIGLGSNAPYHPMGILVSNSIQNAFCSCDLAAEFQLNAMSSEGKEESGAQFDVVTAWELVDRISHEKLTSVCQNVARHLAPGGLWILSINTLEQTASRGGNGRTLQHQSWWLELFRSCGFTNHPELVQYFGKDWIRGPLQFAAGSFHLVLTHGGQQPPVLPSLPGYDVADVMQTAQDFLNRGNTDYALALFDDARRHFPRDVTIYQSQAKVVDSLGWSGEADLLTLKAQAISQQPMETSAVIENAIANESATSFVSLPEECPVTIGDDRFQPDKLLSLIVPARNDTYMGDFKWRFSTCLNYMARNLSAIGRLQDVEVVVCDWNSDVPLHKELVLSPAVRQLVRFVVVPPRIARHAQGDSAFPIVIAQNVAIRRCRGQYIGQTDSDVLYSHSSLLGLLAVLDGKIPGIPLPDVYLCAPRRHIPYAQVVHQPSIQEIDEYLLRSGSLLKEEPPSIGFAAPTTLCLMHRSMWQATRGYNERYLHWGWMDSDLTLRINQRYPMLYLSNFGVNLIHLEHYADRRKQPRKMNFCDDMPAFQANDEQWGMANHAFDSYRTDNVAELQTTRPSQVGSIASWNLTIAELQAQLNHTSVAQYMQQIGQMYSIGPEDLAAFTGLAWYALNHHPRTFVEIGLVSAVAGSLVTIASHGVELYGIVHWYKEVLNAGAYAHAAHWTLLKAGQQACARWVGGDPNTAVARLASSNAGQFRVDLALVRADARLPHSAAQACELANHLSSGGAMVVSGIDNSSFAAVWSELSSRHPRLTYVPVSDGRTGLALAATLKAVAGA